MRETKKDLEGKCRSERVRKSFALRSCHVIQCRGRGDQVSKQMVAPSSQASERTTYKKRGCEKKKRVLIEVWVYTIALVHCAKEIETLLRYHTIRRISEVVGKRGAIRLSGTLHDDEVPSYHRAPSCSFLFQLFHDFPHQLPSKTHKLKSPEPERRYNFIIPVPFCLFLFFFFPIRSRSKDSQVALALSFTSALIRRLGAHHLSLLSRCGYMPRCFFDCEPRMACFA